MRMEIDEAGRDELAGNVDTLDGARGRNARLDRGELAVLDSEISLAAELLAGIEHLAVRDHEVVLQRRIFRIETVWRGRAGLREQEGSRPGVDGGWLGCEGGAGSGRRRRDDEVAPRDSHDVVSSPMRYGRVSFSSRLRADRIASRCRRDAMR